MKVYQIVQHSCVGDENIILETYLDKNKAIDRALKHHAEKESEDNYDAFIVQEIEIIE